MSVIALVTGSVFAAVCVVTYRDGVLHIGKSNPRLLPCKADRLEGAEGLRSELMSTLIENVMKPLRGIRDAQASRTTSYSAEKRPLQCVLFPD